MQAPPRGHGTSAPASQAQPSQGAEAQRLGGRGRGPAPGAEGSTQHPHPSDREGSRGGAVEIRSPSSSPGPGGTVGSHLRKGALQT